MSTVEETQDLIAWQLESDLASLACQAAIELDNLVLGRATTFPSVGRLVAAIAESVPEDDDPGSPSSSLDATAALALNRAISEVIPGSAPTHVTDLVRRVAGITQQLSELVSNPGHSRVNRASELKQMRSLCLALSKHASASMPSPEERTPEHPFRS